LTRSPGAGGESAFREVFAGFGVVNATDGVGLMNASETSSGLVDFSLAGDFVFVVSSGVAGKMGAGREDVEIK
jgi:hypothetical protein